MATTTFTLKTLDHPPRPKSGFSILFDTKSNGLALRVPATGTPTFQVISRDHLKKEKRITIGTWIPNGAIDCNGVKMDLEAIRTLSTAVRANLKAGRPPLWSPAQDIEPWQTFSLREALELHIAGGRAKGRLMESTEANYRATFRVHLGDWLDRPLRDLSRAAVRERHLLIADKGGKGIANNAMRILAAVWNRARKQHPELGEPPTGNVDKFDIEPRDYGLREEHVEGLWQLFHTLDDVRRDWFLTVLFTGLRRTSVSEMRVEDVDLQKKHVHIPKPKGGKRRAFTLPLCNQLQSILERRVLASQAAGSPWVFPANSKSGHLEEPRAEGLPSPHALRGLFTTVAGNLIPAYPLKALLNHARQKTDVTDRYINFGPEQLRPHAQTVADRLSQLAMPPIQNAA